MHSPFATMTAQPETITLIGRASNLAYDENWGTARWTISVRRSGAPEVVTDFNLKAFHSRVLEQFEQMDDGQLIGVIAEVPPERERAAGVPLLVTRLELLGKPQEVTP